MEYKLEQNTLTIWLEGHIDSANAPAVERELSDIRAEKPAESIVLDCERLSYISSAGLRIILRVKKAVPDTKLVNVSADVYEIFDMTGFTEMMDIQKAYRIISVAGCEVIGQGANGKVYRIDRDTVVKAYHNPEALADIHKERELARTAFVLGVPTAIPYDVVRIEGGGYGSVFELLNATNFAKLLIRGEKTLDEVAKMSIDLPKIIHSTEVKPDSMPSMKQIALHWADFLKDHLPANQYEKLHALIAAVPENNHMMHGDYHIKNITRQGEENLILDMDTLCHGHPVFELASMYNAYCGFSELDHEVSERFLGISHDQAVAFWKKSLMLYLGTTDESVIRSVEEKAMLIGYTRLLRRRIRRDGYASEEGRREIECYKAHIADLLTRLEDLTF